MKRVAWVLNLDAELELARPDETAGSSRHQAQVRHHGQRFLAGVNESGQAAGYTHAAARDGEAPDHLLAWCPTPRVLGQLATTQGEIPRAPDLQCLQRVNNRRFLTTLTDGLPGSRFVHTMDQLTRHLQVSPTPPDGWLLKRGFGFSGRWRKRLPNLRDEASRRWCEASMGDYGQGLQVEPFVPILAEFTRHGLIDRDGSVLRGGLTSLQCDESGGWLDNHRRAEEITAEEQESFDLAFTRASQVLAEAGYWGPFGIDGFRWRDPLGKPRWQPLSDLNARFTMGFFVGMHDHHQQVVEAMCLA